MLNNVTSLIFLLLVDSHTMTLHTVALHSIAIPFRDLKNQLYLLRGSMIDPTSQNKNFQCALFSLTRFSGNFLEGYLSQM